MEDFKSSQSASWVYVQQDISEIKSNLKEWSQKQLDLYSQQGANSKSPFWVPIVMELIKLIAQALVILAGLAAFAPQLIKILMEVKH